MKQNEIEKSIDCDLWKLLGGNQYHTNQILRIKYDKLMKEKQNSMIEHLNRNSRFKIECLD